MIIALINSSGMYVPSLRSAIIRGSIVPDDFLNSCVDEMLRAYSHAMESVSLGYSKSMTVRSLDYDIGNIGPIVLICRGQDAHIYHQSPTKEDKEEVEWEGKRLFDTTLPIKGLYSEMHKFVAILNILQQAYATDKSKVFGMDLSKNFEPFNFSQARYFNTDNGESGMVTDLPEGHEWLKKYMAEYGLEHDPADPR